MYADLQNRFVVSAALGRNCIKKTIEWINVRDRHCAVREGICKFVYEETPVIPFSFSNVRKNA